MRSKIFNLNWSDFDYRNPESRKNLAGALQYFCAMPNQFVPGQLAQVKEFVEAHDSVRKAQVQAFTLPSDFPTYERAIEVLEKFHITPEWDNGFEQIFDIRDFSGSKASGFDVLDVQSGLTFNQVLPGEKIKVYEMSGAKERCYFNYYGGALGWHRGLFEDQEFWVAEDNAIEFRNKAYFTRAQVFYSLLAAVGDHKSCCSVVPAPSGCTGCDSDAQSIAASINYAIETILTNCSGKGYGLNPASTNFIVLNGIDMMGRVKQALAVRTQGFAESPRVLNYPVSQITSLMPGGTANSILVILPKKKIKGGYRMDLTLFDDFDILSYTDTIAGWMRYGGCIGDLDQIECIAFDAVSGSCPPARA